MLLASLALAADEVPFEASAMRFADAPACRAHLETMVVGAQGYEVARGPYAIAEGDVRIHRVAIEGAGHRIEEYRCLGSALASRSWRRSMAADEKEFTLESVTRDAEWLKQDVPQQ